MKRVCLAAFAAQLVLAMGAGNLIAQVFEDRAVRPATAEAAPPMAEPTPRPDRRVTILLSDGTRLVGAPVELEELPFKTAYGELKIPHSKIDGLRFGDYPTGSEEHACSILFKNGDRLSARLQLSSWKIETLVGEVGVPAEHLRTVVMSVDGKVWVQVGEEWKLMPVTQPASPYSTAPSPYGSPAAPATYGAPTASYDTPVYAPDATYPAPRLAPAPAYTPVEATPSSSYPPLPAPVIPPMAR